MVCLSKYALPFSVIFREEDMFGLFGGCFESLRLSQFDVTDGAEERRCGCKEKHDLTAAPPHTSHTLQHTTLFGKTISKLPPCIWGVLLLRAGCRWQPPGEGMCDPRGRELSVGWDKYFGTGGNNFMLRCDVAERWHICNIRRPSSPGQQHADALQIVPPSSNLQWKG